LIFVILVSRGSTPPGLSMSLDSLDMTIDVLRSSVGCIKQRSEVDSWEDVEWLKVGKGEQRANA
jgi:hypothetical protein